jgi:hypothetical protein
LALSENENKKGKETEKGKKMKIGIRLNVGTNAINLFLLATGTYFIKLFTAVIHSEFK